MRVDQKASFLSFVYPFLLKEPARFSDRLSCIDGASWPGRAGALKVWEPEDFPRDDLLAHFVRYLNPPDGIPPTARLWRVSGAALQSPFGLGRDAKWTLTLPHAELPFRLDDAQLTLFRVGVGFLTMCSTPYSESSDDWLDFLHYYRFVRGQRRVRIRLHRSTDQRETRPFFPEVAGGTAQHPEGVGELGEVLDALLRSGMTPGDAEPWWRDVFVPGQLLPFAVLFVDGVEDGEVGPLVYRVRNVFHAQQEIHPSTEDLRIDHPSVLPYVSGAWFTFSMDGAGFVGCNMSPRPFFRETLPIHLKDQYFLLYLLALHQRFALMMLSEEVAQNWPLAGDHPADDTREEAFGRIRDALLAFTARGHFAQVMQREHHHRCYRKWQDIFQIERLYREVSDEVREMHDFLVIKRAKELRESVDAEERQGRSLERRLSQIALLFGVPGLGLAYLQVIGPVSWKTGLAVALGGLLIGVVLIAALGYGKSK